MCYNMFNEEKNKETYRAVKATLRRATRLGVVSTKFFSVHCNKLKYNKKGMILLKNYEKLKTLKKVERQRFIEAQFLKQASEFSSWLESEFEEEVWLDAKDGLMDYAGYYQVSNRGRVRSVDREVENAGSMSGTQKRKGKILKPSLNNKGYYIVYLSLNGKKRTVLVSRLVGFAFCEGYQDKYEINHKNGKHTDNEASNLEWVSGSENRRHAQEMGLRGSKKAVEI